MSEPHAAEPFVGAREFASALRDAAPGAPIVVDLGWRGRRRVTWFAFGHGFGPVKVRVETWRELCARVRQEHQRPESEDGGSV